MLKLSKSIAGSLPSRMRALELRDYESKSEVVEKLVPIPGPGEVLVRVAASPINPSDWAFLQGLYGIEKELPIVPGFECSGTVVAAGSGLLPRLWLGRRVACIAPSDGDGTWAEYMVSKANSCMPLIKSVNLEEGAMTLVNPMSAWAILDISRGEGHKALANNAAASALGQMLMRLGQRLNYPMVHIVYRQEQAELLRDQGALNILNCSDPDFDERMQEVFHNMGVTIAFDAIAGEMTARLLTALPDGGKVVVYGGLSQAALMANPLDIIFHNKQVDGFWLSAWVSKLSLLGLIRLTYGIQRSLSTDFETKVHVRASLEDAMDALDDYLAGMTRGKVLIVPGLMKKNDRSNLQKTV